MMKPMASHRLLCTFHRIKQLGCSPPVRLAIITRNSWIRSPECALEDKEAKPLLTLPLDNYLYVVRRMGCPPTW